MDFSQINWIELIKIFLPAILVLVATLYSKRILQREERTYSLVHQTYLSEGLHKIEFQISTYGTTTHYALIDIKREVSRLKDDPKLIKKLKIKIAEIRERKYVSKLIDRDYGISTESFSRLLKFGMPLYISVKRTLYTYSRWLEDITDIYHLEKQLVNIDAFLGRNRGIEAVSFIIQHTEIYLETRVRYLSDYISGKNYKTYSEFLKLNEDNLIQKFIHEIEGYNDLLQKWRDSMGQSPSDRQEASGVLSKWLSEHIYLNPLLNNDLRARSV